MASGKYTTDPVGKEPPAGIVAITNGRITCISQDYTPSVSARA